MLMKKVFLSLLLCTLYFAQAQVMYEDAESGNINGFMMRGSGRIDDISLN